MHSKVHSPSIRQLAVLAALVMASGLGAVMVLGRVLLSGTGRYLFLLWNLFLAWIPFLVSLAVYNAHRRRRPGGWIAIGLAGLWLLFFPNAPYVVTDLLHLQWADQFPTWYDVIMLASFAWICFMLGFASLYLMQTLVTRAAGRGAGWLFACAVLGLSAFGIYLGRFLGWNSWDVFFNPAALLADVWRQVRHPLAHATSLAFSTMLAAFLISTYLVLVAFAHLPQEAHGTIRD